MNKIHREIESIKYTCFRKVRYSGISKSSKDIANLVASRNAENDPVSVELIDAEIKSSKWKSLNMK